MKKVHDALKKMGMIDNPEISELKRENDLLKKQLGEKKEDKDDKHFDILKKDLANDFQKLYEKERIINDKEEEMKLLLKKYNFLYGVRHIQMDISPGNPVNDFDYELRFHPIIFKKNSSNFDLDHMFHQNLCLNQIDC
jgi:hypothetical protein